MNHNLNRDIIIEEYKPTPLVIEIKGTKIIDSNSVDILVKSGIEEHNLSEGSHPFLINKIDSDIKNLESNIANEISNIDTSIKNINEIQKVQAQDINNNHNGILKNQAEIHDVSNNVIRIEAELVQYPLKKDLSKVAFSGEYTDLLNTPNIPSIEGLATTSYVNSQVENINTSLNTKVDKVTGKSLISDTEITRLSTVENYNDTQIKEDISKKQNKLTTGDNISIVGDVISATDTIYTPGDNISIIDNVISSRQYDDTKIKEDINKKQDKLIAGDNISIVNNNISAIDTTYTAGDNISIVNNNISAIDTTYTAGDNISIVNNNISAIDTTYTAGDNITIEQNVISSALYDDTKIKEDISKKQDKLIVGTNISITGDTISAIDTKYTAGDGISISTDNVITNTKEAEKAGFETCLKADLPTSLEVGVPKWCTDTKELYVGTGNGVHLINPPVYTIDEIDNMIGTIENQLREI